ncbi:microaggregate-binding protein 1 [Nocardia alni]|uniref:microaggregate-binding protein 1 n=1 Tax=Nocardia alni TaxID=2815723 RepID=UPI001C21AE40|nr:CsbD family protein [Nocardia alni]
MSEHDKGSAQETFEGIAEGVKGKVKEAAGAIVDDDALRQEGRAQQDRAAAQRGAAHKQAQADIERGKAAAAEKREQAHQHDDN